MKKFIRSHIESFCRLSTDGVAGPSVEFQAFGLQFFICKGALIYHYIPDDGPSYFWDFTEEEVETDVRALVFDDDICLGELAMTANANREHLSFLHKLTFHFVRPLLVAYLVKQYRKASPGIASLAA